MLVEVISVVAGVLLGILPTLFFERRRSAQVRRERDELKAQLRTLQEGIYTMGGTKRFTRPPSAERDLIDELHLWLQGHQDAGGRVPRAQAISEFATRGWEARQIDLALTELGQRHDALCEGEWIHLR